MGYSKRVFKPQETVNYELNISHIFKALRVLYSVRKHGILPKNFLDESLGLARSFFRALVLRAHRRAALAITHIKSY